MIDRSNLKQPREGITGVQRDDFLLSLDEKAVAHRDALIAMARHLQTASLVGNPAPVVQRIYERIKNPQPGDLVVESSTGVRTRDLDTRTKAFGILIEHRNEWWETDAEWEAQKRAEGWDDDEDRRVDHAWYIQYGNDPGDVCRWVNCDFLAIPIDPKAFDYSIGTRLPVGGVSVDRDDVVAGLAASGFEVRSDR
jgi:hypothetical protein